jgi:predicted metal-dependent phosphoesterase TrpH
MSTTSTWTGTADLHMHTRHSDGAPTVEELLRHVVTRTTLDVIAITDHDTIGGALEAQDIVRRESYPIEVVVGEEVSTRDGHLVGLFLSERVIPGLSAAETVAAIHAQGGLAFAPHPYLRVRQKEGRPITMVGLGGAIRDLALDAIETVNATPFLGRANRRAAAYNVTRRLPALGNSDGHIPQAIGKGYTLFPGKTALALRAAIACGQTAARARPYQVTELLTYLNFWLHQQGLLPRTAVVPRRVALELHGQGE